MPALIRKKKRKESWFKYAFALSHLWLGLLSSIVLFVVCLTGTILVFEEPIKRALNSDVMRVEPGNKRIPLDKLLARYQETHTLAPGSITIPQAKDEAIHFFAFDRSSGERISVYANPYTGEFQGYENEAAMEFFSTMLQMHRWLLVRDIGKAIVGASTVIFLFMLLSGIVLWWPSRSKKMKRVLTINWRGNFYKVNYDLHNVLGFYSMIGLFFIASTGLYFSYPVVRDGLKTALGAETEIDRPTQSQGNKDQRKKEKPSTGRMKGKKRTMNNPQLLENGLSAVQQALPYSSDIRISFPGRRSTNYTFTKHNTSNMLGARLPESVEINNEGEVVGITPYSDLSPDRKVTSIIKPLHTGEIMGWPSMILYFILCLVGTSLPVTGFIIWLKRDAKKKKNARRKKPVPMFPEPKNSRTPELAE